MQCYREGGGCGPYEMYSCSECPASKPEYSNRRFANEAARQLAEKMAANRAKVNLAKRDNKKIEQGRWDMFMRLTTIEYGKQCYFLQDNGTVYSRRSGTYMSFDDAIKEFCNAQGWDW